MSTLSEKIQRFTCRIARRGKAAKGSVVVALFGKPVKPKDKTKDDGVTRKVSYDHHKNLNTSDLIDEVRKIAHINLILMLGADSYIRSNGIQSQSELSIIAAMIYNAGLALDSDEAVSVAKQFRDFRSLSAKLNHPVPSIESLMENRKKEVDSLKAKGLWKKAGNSPRLNKDTKPEVEEPKVEEEPEEDSDDIIDEDEELVDDDSDDDSSEEDSSEEVTQ